MFFAQTLAGYTLVRVHRAPELAVGSFLQNLIKTGERGNAPTNYGRPRNVERQDKPRNEPPSQKRSKDGSDYPLYVTEGKSESVREGGALGHKSLPSSTHYSLMGRGFAESTTYTYLCLVVVDRVNWRPASKF